MVPLSTVLPSPAVASRSLLGRLPVRLLIFDNLTRTDEINNSGCLDMLLKNPSLFAPGKFNDSGNVGNLFISSHRILLNCRQDDSGRKVMAKTTWKQKNWQFRCALRATNREERKAYLQDLMLQSQTKEQLDPQNSSRRQLKRHRVERCFPFSVHHYPNFDLTPVSVEKGALKLKQRVEPTIRFYTRQLELSEHMNSPGRRAISMAYRNNYGMGPN